MLVGRRAGGQHNDQPAHSWQMPQGGIDADETPLEAARRELYEETNVRSASLLAEAPDWFSYDLPDTLRKTSWKGRYRGQTQRWFAFRFEGEESEINVLSPANGAHEPEFEEWRWIALADTPALIVPFKRRVYEQVVAAFMPYAPREDR